MFTKNKKKMKKFLEMKSAKQLGKNLKIVAELYKILKKI